MRLRRTCTVALSVLLALSSIPDPALAEMGALIEAQSPAAQEEGPAVITTEEDAPADATPTPEAEAPTPEAPEAADPAEVPAPEPVISAEPEVEILTGDEPEADGTVLEAASDASGAQAFGGQGEHLGAAPSIHDGTDGLDAQASLPASYSSVAKGYVTPVRNQNPFNTCWAFATTAAIEASMLRRGLAAQLGYTKDTLDLSEYQLGYFTFGSTYDPLGNTSGDQTLPKVYAYSADKSQSQPDYLNNTGNAFMTSFALASWAGIGTEQQFPYDTLRNVFYSFPPSSAYYETLSKTVLPASQSRTAVARLKNAYFVPMTDKDDVKRAVMDYGGAVILMHFDEYNYCNYKRSGSTNTAYFYYNGSEGTNHLVTIVGWDDGVATGNFGVTPGPGARPKSNGAWLCKNSWGPDYHGTDGYFWLSYEDACVIKQSAKLFEMEKPGLQDNLYQYDGTRGDAYNYINPGGSIANVYTAKAGAQGERLTAASFALWDANIDYSLQVYTNILNPKDPTSGTAALTKPVTGRTSYAGIYKVDVPGVNLTPNTTYSVVLTLNRANRSQTAPIKYFVDSSFSSWYITKSSVKASQSFEKDSAKAGWDDLATAKPDSGDEQACCARIKAFTSNASIVSAGTPHVAYRTHVQTYGWQNYVRDGATAGTSGESKRLEALNVRLEGAPSGSSIEYRTHVQSYGWQGFQKNDALSGTSGKGKRLEAIQIRLSGPVAQNYDVWYRVHAQRLGWMGWAKNDAPAGTAGYAYRLEALQIKVLPKGSAAPGSQVGAFQSKTGVVPRALTAGHDVSYSTHVQSIGWQEAVADGTASGTFGMSKRLEAIRITLPNRSALGYTGSIKYRTHVQKKGWQDYVADGALSGTSGESKRLEAIQIKLSGQMAMHYDVWYRVHAQTFGWMGWAKNDAQAGTAGYAKRLEAIQILLLPKGSSAPGSTANAFRKK